MAAARGIAGSTRPERDGVFLCRDESEAAWFVRMNNTGGPVDVWEVVGIQSEELVDAGSGFVYLPDRIPVSQVALTVWPPNITVPGLQRASQQRPKRTLGARKGRRDRRSDESCRFGDLVLLLGTKAGFRRAQRPLAGLSASLGMQLEADPGFGRCGGAANSKAGRTPSAAAAITGHAPPAADDWQPR
jgi:hypothetical protein